MCSSPIGYLLYMYGFLDPAARKRRKKYGGNKGKCFTEGWLEFKDRRVAKSVAATLNNTIVGL